MEKFYRKILARALKISWKNPWLWIFGLFAAFIGNGSIYEALFRSLNNLADNISPFATLADYLNSGVLGMISWQKFVMLSQGDVSGLVMMLLTLLLFICVVALIIGLGVVFQAGAIYSVVEIDEKKHVSYKQAFKHGVERFWPVLELNVFTKLVMLGVLFLLVYLVYQFAPQSIALYVVATILFVLSGIVIYFLTVFGTAFIVLRKKSALVALNHAWHLFRHNILLSLEMGLILFIINVLAIIAFFIAGFIILSPFFLLYVILVLSGMKLIATIVAMFMAVVFFLFIFLVGAWWATFQLGAWALLFEELVLKGGRSKIGRVWDLIRGKR